MSAPRGCLLWEEVCSGGGCLLPGVGGCAWWRHAPPDTAAGGTHPTGMHSCTEGINVLNSIVVCVLTRLNLDDKSLLDTVVLLGKILYPGFDTGACVPHNLPGQP